MSDHCPVCCRWDRKDWAKGDNIACPGLACPACAEKDTQIADLKYIIAKRARVRVSVHDVWLRERERREKADAEIARLTLERDRAIDQTVRLFTEIGNLRAEVQDRLEEMNLEAARAKRALDENARLRALVDDMANYLRLDRECPLSDTPLAEIQKRWRSLEGKNGY